MEREMHLQVKSQSKETFFKIYKIYYSKFNFFSGGFIAYYILKKPFEDCIKVSAKNQADLLNKLLN